MVTAMSMMIEQKPRRVPRIDRLVLLLRVEGALIKTGV